VMVIPVWDGVWISDARTAKQGWTATIGIPFSTLNFMQSRDVMWGIETSSGSFGARMTRTSGPIGRASMVLPELARLVGCKAFRTLGVGVCSSLSPTD
jgi:hypothetical protein